MKYDEITFNIPSLKYQRQLLDDKIKKLELEKNALDCLLKYIEASEPKEPKIPQKKEALKICIAHLEKNGSVKAINEFFPALRKEGIEFTKQGVIYAIKGKIEFDKLEKKWKLNPEKN